MVFQLANPWCPFCARSRYYTACFGSNGSDEDTARVAKDACRAFCAGLSWCFAYYTRGTTSAGATPQVGWWWTCLHHSCSQWLNF